jgi:signal transduction histidine kinase
LASERGERTHIGGRGCGLYTQWMTVHSPSSPRTPGACILGPLNPPAYLTWLAVSLSPLLDWGGSDTLTARVAVGLAGQFAFAVLFLLRAIWEGRPSVAHRLRPLIAAQAAVSLLAVWGLQDKMQAVLLVLVAAQMPAAEAPRWGAAVLGFANVVLLALFIQFYPPVKALQMEIAYLAFQLFAALVTAYAYRAFEARAATLRINGELMATRRLLEESARTEERLRLSRELHDIMGHKLTALKLQLALQTRGTAVPRDSPLHHCARITDELLVDVRGVVSSLRESDGIDLHQALRALDPGLPTPRVIFDLDSTVRVPDIRQAEAMLRCAQEGLTNALRHSGAAEVRVTLAGSGEALTLTVVDDGNGSVIEPGNGLIGLKERLQQLGGQLRIDIRAPRGLALVAILPRVTVSVR